MTIQFGPEAGSTLQRVLADMSGYCVRVRVHDEDERFRELPDPMDVQLIGVGEDWFDAVVVKRWSEDEGRGVGEAFTVRVWELYVY